MRHPAVRAAVIFLYAAAWLAAGLHPWVEAPDPAESCGCGPGPTLTADCRGCDRSTDHHHHNRGGHDHSTCVICAAPVVALSPDPTAQIGCVAVELEVATIEAFLPNLTVLSSITARGPPSLPGPV